MSPARSHPFVRPTVAALVLACGLLAAGRLGAAEGFVARVPAPLAARPLAVECVAAPGSSSGFNVFVACGPKESADHWELYTYAGGGDLSVYVPGCEPAEIRSGVNVCDGKPHHLAATIAADEVRMWVDGREVARVAVRPRDPAATGTAGERTLWLGGYGGQIGCDGPLDLVRVSHGLRDFGGTTVADEIDVDVGTLALWRPADADAHGVADAGPSGLVATRGATAAAPAPAPRMDDHFGVTSVGFAWQESDSRDDRWQATDVGPFLSLSLDTPSGPAARALAVKLGGTTSACFDTVLGSYRSVWTGGFLRFDPSRYGLIGRPVIAGDVRWDAGAALWPDRPVRFRAVVLHGDRTLTETLVGDRVVLETATAGADPATVVRSLEVQPGRDGLVLVLARAANATARREGPAVVLEREGRRLHAALLATTGPGCAVAPHDDRIELVLPPADVPLRVDVALRDGDPAAAAPPVPGPLRGLTQGGVPRWAERLVTRGRRGTGSGAFVLDTVPLPVDNPWRALLFVGDHDFFPDGRLALCTVHGDVWLVDGLDDALEAVRWKRFATGLFHPLGLEVIDGHVHVLGRDRITRLIDVDGDDEADRYESFSDANPTSLGGHDYAAGLEADSRGNLHYLQCAPGGMGGLYRVSPDGSRQELVADGFRNPNGLGIGPGDVITVAPQEGDWTPASCICEVRPGGFYGFGGPRPGAERPRGYDPPLCWIPRMVDNSSGSQVWLTSDRYGPLADMPVSLSFGRCRLLLVLRESFSGDGGERVQGGTVDLGLAGASGLIRGCIGTHDGLLWVSGTKGWVSSGVEDGCLQRVRPTGEPVRLPIAVETHANGLLVRWSVPLDPDSAGDPGAWDVAAWNYRYSAGYGSADYSLSAPDREGHDPLPVRSATLLEENRAVFLELGRVPEAMQVAIRGNVRAADATPLDRTIHWTINGVRSTRIEPSAAALAAAREADGGDEIGLEPGLRIDVRVPDAPVDAGDVRTSRLAALAVPAGHSATPWLPPGPFRATFTGFLRTTISSDVRLGLRGHGTARVRVAGAEVLAADGDLSGATPAVVRLRRGSTPVVIDYAAPADGPATFELLWSAGGPGLTPVPPQALAHDPRSDASLERATILRAGREAFADHGCASCHAAGDLHPALVRTPPRLDGIGSRVTTAWLVQWLADPTPLGPHSTMPHLLDGQPATAAADIAAWLASRDAPAAAAVPAPQAEVDRGLVLWERLGCIGCHTLAAATTDDRRSLALAAAKYTPAGLAAFLVEPHAHRPATAMPDFSLTAQDARSLAAFLAARGQPLPTAAVADGDPQRGRQFASALGCGRCHAGLDATATAAPPLAALHGAALDRGCLGSGADGSPRWSMPATTRAALVAFLADGPRSHRTLERDAAADRAAHAFATLRCGTCHARDGRPAGLPAMLLEEGELGLPLERLPDLTWAGEKLRGDWTEALLAGRVSERPRPWLAARMPAWPGHAAGLATGLAAEHGLVAVGDPSEPSPAEPATELGGRLVERDGGLDCRQCHGLGPRTPRQDNDAQGISFRHVRGRLRRDWYDRWMLDPLAIEPATKMPRFAADGTHTAVTAILDGDARGQFAAIWSWLGTVAADVTLPAATGVVAQADDVAARARRLFHRDNLVAWCIVPFDARRRTPEERAEMLERLGFRHFAYDWRDEHVPEFTREFDALARHGVALDAFWSPGGHAPGLLETFRGRGLRPAFWVMIAAPDDLDQEAKVRHAADAIRPLCTAAAAAGCSVALYNHGGWGGEPENQIAVIEALGLDGVGIVYNQHHGHDHLPRFKELLPKMLPHLRCLNLNGMTAGGDRIGKKILPLGQGDLDVDLLRTIVESGYDGPIGILGHTDDDAEQRLLDNLEGLDWVVGELTGAAIPKPVPRTK